MRLHPEVVSHLDKLEAAGVRRTSESTVDEARGKSALLAELVGRGPSVHSLRTVSIPVAGGLIEARVYEPTPEAADVLVWFHGGGWVIGDVTNFDAVCATMALEAGVRVVSVNYRLAPEFPYPTAVGDAMSAVKWTREHLLPAGAMMAVGGDSAGGNIAAVVSQQARHEQDLDIRLQVLVYPVTDCDLTRPSYATLGNDLPLGVAEMEWYWGHYVADQGRRTDPAASPLRAADLSGLPPARIVLAEYDVLADEGRAYAAALREAGNDVVVDVWEGTIHGFYNMVGYFQLADLAVARVCDAIRLATGTAGSA